MSRRVVASILSFLLTFTLLLPMVGAEGNGLTEASGSRQAKFGLDPHAVTQEALKSNLDTPVQSKQQQGASQGGAVSPASSRGLVLERQEEGTVAVGPQSFVPLSDGDEQTTVIVELREEPVKVFEATRSQMHTSKSVTTHKQAVDLQQQIFKKQAAGKLKAKINREYSNVFNGFSLTLPANQVEALLQLPGVKAVYPNLTVHATEEEAATANPLDSVSFIGSGEFWDEGVKGQGIKVGVIDTGIAKDHPDLADAIPEGYWGYDFVNNDQVPYETTRQDYLDAKELNPSLPEFNENGRPYYTSHGSHVSGIVAGRDVGVSESAGVKGVAPEADVYAYKVLGPYGSGTTENVIAGIEQAVVDGMDVINLSLGSSSNNQQSADSIALNNAMKAGVIAVVSAGNSGPGDATVTDPGSSELAITVGASKPPLTTPIMQVSGIAGQEFFLDSFDRSAGVEGLTDSYVLVDVGLGKPENYDGKNLAGKIAFIKRGEISFADKALNAQASGAVAAIIFNNVPEALESGTLGDINISIPVYALSGAYGEQIVTALQQQEQAAEFTTTLEADIMAGFSSRGPAKPAYDIKPDISAPGIGIRSSVPEYEDWYVAQNGTSMAAPHIAGAAALLAQQFPALTTYEIKALLMNNTVKLTDRNGHRYTHMDQGAGRVALDQVLEAKAIALVEDTTPFVAGDEPETFYNGSLSFGYVGYGQTASQPVIVKDIAGAASQYSVASQWYGQSPIELTLSTNQVNVPAGGAGNLTITVDVPADAVSQRYEGEVTLTEASTGHTINLPLSVYVGEAPQVDIVTNVALSNNPFSPNGDGLFDTADITFTIQEYTDYFSLDVHGLDGEWLGTVLETDEGIDPGNYIIRGWDGSAFDGLSEAVLSDDAYLLVPYVGPSFFDSLPIEDQAYVFFLDTEAPQAHLNDPAFSLNESGLTGTISGEVTQDLLIDYLVTLAGLSIGDVIGVAALYSDGNGELQQSDGVIDDSGQFKIEVPVAPGHNVYEVYVYDLAGNGILVPLNIVEHELNGVVSPVLQDSVIEANTPFSLDVRFSVTEAVYAAELNLLYSSELGEANVLPGTELVEHQEDHNPGVPLTVTEGVYEVDAAVTRHELAVSLNGVEDYLGAGTLASFQFAGAPAGQYEFTLTDVKLYNQHGQEVQVTLNRGASLTVTEGPVQPNDELLISPSSLSLKKGESSSLSVTYKSNGSDETGVDVTAEAEYTVQNPQIVAVSAGRVTGLKAGITVIDVTYRELSEQVNVTVTDVTTPPNNGGGSSGGGSKSSSGTTSPPKTDSNIVKSPIQAGEATTLKLPGGLTLTIPADAVDVPGAAFASAKAATETETKELLGELGLDGDKITSYGVYYDFAILDKDQKPLSNVTFREPAETVIPLSALKASELEGEKIGLFKLGEDGKLTPHTGRIKDGNVVAKLHGFSQYIYLAKQISFADVTEASYPWAINEIEILAAKDIVTGTAAGLYNPSGQVTRAEFVALLVRALELTADEKSTAGGQFSDVGHGIWYEEAVNIAVAKGIISGYEGGVFAPDRSITRAEIAVILSKALAALGQSSAATPISLEFADREQIPAWATGAVAEVTQAGLMKGKTGQRFEAGLPTTRAEAAVVIYRLFKGFTH